MFLYCSVSTLNPMVGIVVIGSSTCNRSVCSVCSVVVVCVVWCGVEVRGKKVEVEKYGRQQGKDKERKKAQGQGREAAGDQGRKGRRGTAARDGEGRRRGTSSRKARLVQRVGGKR